MVRDSIRSGQEGTFDPISMRTLFYAVWNEYSNGRLTIDRVRSFLQKLVMYDAEGNVWTIGARSGKWYRRVGDGWVEDEPRGPLTPAQLNIAIRPQTIDPRASRKTVQFDRRAKRRQELEEDRLAEGGRRRRGLTPDQELEEIKSSRPIFMEEYDKREHQRVLWLWNENEERARERGAQSNRGLHHRYASPPPKKPWIFDLERYLNELTPEQLRLYEAWKPRIDSFWRRYPEKWE